MAEKIILTSLKEAEKALDARVTVLIVNYNAGSVLADCIKSILASTVSVDIVIVDNASTDTSISEVLSEFKQTHHLFIYRCPANVGFSRANNAAYPLIESDYILYLNPDCFIEPNTIENMLLLMDAQPKAAMATCLIRNEDGSEQRGCRGFIPTPWRSMMQFLPFYRWFPKLHFLQGYTLNHLPLPSETIRVQLISGAFMFTRRKAISDVGLLDENYFLYCEDYDWFQRFNQKGWEILFSPAFSVTHLKGLCGKKIPLRIFWYKTKGMLYFYNKFFQKQGFFLKNWFIKSVIVSRFFLLVGLYSIKSAIKFCQTKFSSD